MKKIFLGAIISLFLAIAAKANPADSLFTYSQLGKIAKPFTPAMQIAYWDGSYISHYNYGVKKVGEGEAIDSETIFQACSLSKIVAAYAFLILADKGLLDLDKPLWDYYQYDRLRNEPFKELMTARMVLTHQTGLKNWVAPANSEKWKNSELHANFKPGTDYMYSGEAYTYLQYVAEKITGKSLNEICEEYIFKPFGMKQSSFIYQNSFKNNIAYAHKDATTPAATMRGFKVGNAAYTLLSTADEYMRFLIEAVINGKGLSKKMHDEFLTPQGSTATKGKEKEKDKHVKVCFGIRSQDNEVGRAYWHTGSNGGGFKCIFLIYPNQKKAVAIFTNSIKGWDVNLPVFQQAFGKNQTYWLLQR